MIAQRHSMIKRRPVKAGRCFSFALLRPFQLRILHLQEALVSFEQRFQTLCFLLRPIECATLRSVHRRFHGQQEFRILRPKRLREHTGRVFLAPEHAAFRVHPEERHALRPCGKLHLDGTLKAARLRLPLLRLCQRLC